MSKENIALIDMDGTICDYTNAINTELKKLRSPNEPIIDPFETGDNPHYQYLWDRMEHIKAHEDWWANMPRLQLGFDVMKTAKDLGYTCEILTQAPRTNPAALAGKLQWILKNIGEEIDFTMTRNKSRHYGRVLVDDYPGYITPWLQHRPRGLVIMPANKYNKEFEHEQVIRYDGTNLQDVQEGLTSRLHK